MNALGPHTSHRDTRAKVIPAAYRLRACFTLGLERRAIPAARRASHAEV